MGSREIFLDAAATVADLVARIPGGAWDGPGLGVWDLRALVGHTSRSLVTVSTYLAQRAPRSRSPTPEAYYVADRPAPASANTAAVAQRGVAAGAALGDDPAAAFRTLLDDAADALGRADDDDVVPTDRRRHARRGLPAHPHLRAGRARCATSPPRPGLPVRRSPPAVLAEAAALAARVAVELGRGPVLLAALTGRASLPPGFSVV